MGTVWRGEDGDKEGVLGKVVINSEGKGGVVSEVEWKVMDMVGRGVLVQRVSGTDGAQLSGKDETQPSGHDTVIGVVARSAGTWENEKMVCSCTGKTVWQERAEMMDKGIV